MMGIFLILITVMIFFLGSRWARNCEIALWNNGICKETGEPWIMFDIDSQGGRGYRSGDYTMWASYSIDNESPKQAIRKKYFKKEANNETE